MLLGTSLEGFMSIVYIFSFGSLQFLIHSVILRCINGRQCHYVSLV